MVAALLFCWLDLTPLRIRDFPYVHVLPYVGDFPTYTAYGNTAYAYIKRPQKNIETMVSHPPTLMGGGGVNSTT